MSIRISMASLNAHKVKIMINLENDVEKIEVYTENESFEDELLIRDKDYKLLFLTNETILENITGKKIKRISVFRNTKRQKLNSLLEFEVFYYDKNNNLIATRSFNSNTNIYHIGVPGRRHII